MKHIFKRDILVLFCMVLCICGGVQAKAQTIQTTHIRLNQVGYLTHCEKLAIVKQGRSKLEKFYIKSADLKTTYYEDVLVDSLIWVPARDTIKRADFTAYNIPGRYVIDVPGLGYSYPFEIKDKLYETLNRDALRYFYLNRASTSIPAQYGGVHARAAGHLDTALLVHPSAASELRPAGTKIKAAKGWYDAGDYGCYTTNAGISTYTLMLTYDIHKTYFDTLKLGIPEGNNSIPDILDEIRWNLDWLLAMQDPSDGGVYFKKVSLQFPSFILPNRDFADRYVINKSTQSALDFAAVMAYAARIYKPYDVSFADSCLNAAQRAHAWAVLNPRKLILQNTPDDQSGPYHDSNPADEFFWAGCELYITTKDDTYFPAFLNSYPVAGWPNVGILGCYSLIHNQDSLTQLGKDNLSRAQNPVLSLASVRQSNYNSSAYKIMILPGDFYWGSNSVLLNAIMNHYFAYTINKDKAYLNAISNSFDYILGKNGVSTSFVTKYGNRAPQSPHHRISIALNNIIPGMVVGGPNPRDTYDCELFYPFEYSYVSRLPALCYFDDICSFSTNETAINWNAPLSFVVTALLKEYGCEETDLYHRFDSFEAKAVDCNIALTFKNTDESKVEGYILEKSYDNKEFFKLAEIPNSNSTIYSFLDTEIGLRKVYYRVRSLTYVSNAKLYVATEILEVDFSGEFLNVYPNPASGYLKVDIPCYVSGTYTIHNNFGKVLSEGELSTPHHILDLKSMQSGTYLMTFIVNGKQYKKRIVILQ